MIRVSLGPGCILFGFLNCSNLFDLIKYFLFVELLASKKISFYSTTTISFLSQDDLNRPYLSYETFCFFPGGSSPS